MSKSVVVYFPEGFADWEGAFLLPELRDNKRPAKIVSETGAPVVSIGGMQVHVDGSLDSVQAEDTEAFILIGSETWQDAGKNQKALKMAQDFHARGILIAGICGASVGLARTGLLNNVKHTSNDLGWLKQVVPDYSGEKNYVHELVANDGRIVTAAGVGPVDFTREVMRELKIYPEAKLNHWYALYKHGTPPPADFWG